MQRKQYLVRNRILYVYLVFVDFIFSKICRGKNKTHNESIPKRILISNIAHFGDVITSTTVLPVIKQAFPKCKIGFLSSSQAIPILKNHQYIDYLHQFDHWKLNREEKSVLKRFWKHFSSFKKALKEIRKQKYDVAIDLYYFFPNSIYLFWKAKILWRIGFSSGGFGPLLTDNYTWENRKQYIGRYYLELLASLGIATCKNSMACLPKIDTTVQSIFQGKMQSDFSKKYIVMHVGAGNNKKLWSEKKWQELSHKVIALGYLIIFTGKGDEERQLISRITRHVSNFLNLCDKINWEELFLLVKRAQLVITTDSVISHIAGGYNIPTIVLFHGMNNMHHWIVNKNIFGIINKLPCVPCYSKRGCNEMRCIKEITVDCIMEKIFECLRCT